MSKNASFLVANINNTVKPTVLQGFIFVVICVFTEKYMLAGNEYSNICWLAYNIHDCQLVMFECICVRATRKNTVVLIAETSKCPSVISSNRFTAKQL